LSTFLSNFRTLRPACLSTQAQTLDTLGERWHAADDDPVALLRAESRLHRLQFGPSLGMLGSMGVRLLLS
jgi:hypothetical protein